MTEGASPALSRYRPLLLRGTGTVLLLGLLLWLVDIEQTSATLAALSLGTVVLAAAASLASWLLAIAKWKLLLRNVPVADIARFHFIGMLYNQILPGQIAGEAVKAVRLAKGREDVGRVAASVLVDRLTGLIGLGIVAGAGLLLSPLHIPQLRAIGWLIFAGTLAFTLALFASRISFLANAATELAARVATRTNAIGAGARIFHRFLDAWQAYVKSPGLVLASVIIGIFFQAVGALLVKLLADGLAIDLSLADSAWILGIVSVAILLPVSLGGPGVREFGFVAILGLVGIASAPALSLAIACSAITLCGALIGLALELLQPRSQDADAGDRQPR